MAPNGSAILKTGHGSKTKDANFAAEIKAKAKKNAGFCCKNLGIAADLGMQKRLMYCD